MLDLGIAQISKPITSSDGTQVAIKFVTGDVALALQTWFADGGVWTLKQSGVSFMDDLMALHKSQIPLVDEGCSIKVEGRGISWVSGLPYAFTTFSERAFVFPDRATAEKFIARHPGTFASYSKVTVKEWGK